MSKLLLEDETYAILGACFAVYKDKGHGFLEPVYQECMEIELQQRGIPFTAQTLLPLTYKGVPLKQGYRADLICNGQILVELKAVSRIVDEHRAQLLNYLNATGIQVGLLVNFGHAPKIEHERFVLTR
jgi:GxxExxY protein